MPGSKNSDESRSKEVRKTKFKRWCDRNYRSSIVYVKNETSRDIKVNCSGKVRLQTAGGSVSVNMGITIDGGLNAGVKTGQDNFEFGDNTITSWVQQGMEEQIDIKGFIVQTQIDFYWVDTRVLFHQWAVTQERGKSHCIEIWEEQGRVRVQTNR